MLLAAECHCVGVSGPRIIIIIFIINIIIVGAIESVRRRSLSAPGWKAPQVKGIQVGNMPSWPGGGKGAMIMSYAVL